MKTIPLKSIIISSSRQRREFKPDELNELRESIEGSPAGLLHPIILRHSPEGHVLVAGERRLRAVRDIYDLGGHFRCDSQPVPLGEIPYTLLSNLTPLEAWEAELDENIARADLTWQERAEATAERMRLRKAQAEDRGEPPPTTTELARELHPDYHPEAAVKSVSKELVVSRFLDKPEVRECKSLNEAFKVLKKSEERERNKELGEKVGREYQKGQHRIVLGDLKDLTVDMISEQFEIILTDPPYGMGAHEFGDSGRGDPSHTYDDSYETWKETMEWFVTASVRLATADAHLYAFCDIDNFVEFRDMLGDAGWLVHRTPLIWHNPAGYRAPWPDKGPQRRYEMILFARKGDKKVNHMAGDVLTHRPEENVGHQAQKPVALLVELLKRSARPGDRVWDPFAGSGSTVVACHEMKLVCTASEKDPTHYGTMVKRVGEMK